MAKGIWITLIIIIVILTAGWYLVSPAFDVQKADDESPLTIRDAMTTMSAEEKAEFEAAVNEMSDQTNTMADAMPSDSVLLLSEGNFKPRAHDVEGTALLIQDGDKKTLRFENFHTSNGPNLHIYLSRGLGASDIIDLGKIKATDGNVNYEIPEGTNIEGYDKVLVWCVPFKVLFSYAELS